MNLSLKDVADELNVSVTTVRRWVKSGKLKATLREGLYGPEYSITRDDLNHFNKKTDDDLSVIQELESRPGVNVPLDIMAQAMRSAMEDTLNKLALSNDNRLEQIEQGFTEKLNALQNELASVREENSQLHIALEQNTQAIQEVSATLSRVETYRKQSIWNRIFGK